MDSKAKKKLIRLILFALFVVLVIWSYSHDDVVWWFWMWPLAVVFFIYGFIMWQTKCPSCREDFALEPIDCRLFVLTSECKYCGAQHLRLGGNGTGGGGP